MMLELGRKFAKEQSRADLFSDLLRREKKRHQELLERHRTMQSELMAKSADLLAALAANEDKEASLALALSDLSKMNKPAETSLKIVRGACLRLASHSQGCAVCHQPLAETDTLITGPCLHPSHKKCGEKWRQTRRDQPGQCETCPGCATTVNRWEWYTVPRARLS
jgi:hypothetical protein